jgi:hypothetical protein
MGIDAQTTVAALLRSQSEVLRADHCPLTHPPTNTMIAITATRRMPEDRVFDQRCTILVFLEPVQNWPESVKINNTQLSRNEN